jgi:transcriptional regulator with XRE-family HTH domain
MSQLDLALNADVSARHISFLETGRAQPSREMVLHLAEQLDVPLRERNNLLVSAGFAPVYAQTALDDPALGAAKEAIDLVLSGHEPYPALAIDRHWNLIAANRSLGVLLDNIDPALLEPPINVLRISMHPNGLGPHIIDADRWREHVLARLQRQIEATADPQLEALHTELREYQTPPEQFDATGIAVHRYQHMVIPMRLRTEHGVLSFLTTTTVFGTPLDVTLAELAIESFYPADAQTASVLRSLATR